MSDVSVNFDEQGRKRLIRSRQLQPFAVVEIPRDRCFFKKRIINALVINVRRLRPAVGIVVPHDEILAHSTDRSGVSDPLWGDALKNGAVFHCGNLSRILLRGVPEDENRGNALQ